MSHRKVRDPRVHQVFMQLAKVRISRGLYQWQAAQLAGVQEATLAKWERGEFNPLMANVFAYADALGYDLDIRVVPKGSR